MNDKLWASLGKIITFLGIIVALILGIFQLIDRTQTPSVYGVGEIHDYHLNPKIRELFDARINKDELIGAVKARKKKGESSTNILNDIENSDLPGKSPFHNVELDQYAAFSPRILEFTIYNTGAELARDVKLMLPGEGSAEISEQSLAGTAPKAVNWAGEILLGDLRPQGVLKVMVWPKMMLAPNLARVNPAIIHSKGTGKIMELHSFYGWDANLAAWYLSLGRVTRSALICAFIFVCALILFIARKRGHLVIKPQQS